MKALITGIGGFVGNYLAKELLSNGYKVYGIDINEKKIDNVKFFRVDLLDKKEVFDAVREIKPDVVFHLAAQSSVKKGWEKPELTFDINVNGTKNILDAIGKDVRILVVGSADIYGIPKDVPIREGSGLNPVSPYGKSRLEQEKLVLDYCKKGFQIVMTRSFTHTGPGQLPVFVCSDFAKQIVEVEKGIKEEVLTGNLDVRRDFTDVRDMVRAYLLAVGKCNSGELYNICSGRGFTIKDILDTLLNMSDAKVEVRKDAAKIRKNDILIMIGDNTKFCNATGWEPRIALKQTLKDLLDYWRANL